MVDILNISGNDIEAKIKSSIEATRYILNGLTTLRTCKIYSSYLASYLRENHVLHRVINTSELGLDYEHEFVIVPQSDDKYYLIDLTYSQFSDYTYLGLLDRGYISVSKQELAKYLSLINSMGIKNRFTL